MYKIERSPAPKFLTKNYKKWGGEWEVKQGKGKKFYWHRYQLKEVNHRLLPLLEEMTKGHCSFCDTCPITGQTIEHFRPKSTYPLLAFVWHNLFLCCPDCQKKGDAFDKKLLKPDQLTYEFDKYFMLNFKTGEIQPNIIVEQANQERAALTINLYRLNDFNRPEARLKVLKRYNDRLKDKKTIAKLKNEDFVNDLEIDDYSFRFFIEKSIDEVTLIQQDTLDLLIKDIETL